MAVAMLNHHRTIIAHRSLALSTSRALYGDKWRAQQPSGETRYRIFPSFIRDGHFEIDYD